MHKKIIYSFVCFLIFGLLYWGYGKYRKQQYITCAKAYKEYVYTATDIVKQVIAKTDELKTKSSFIKKKHETTNYMNKEEATNYGVVALQYIMDNNWQVDDMKEYSKVILDSCVREASLCLNTMREYKDYYSYDHQAFETALKTLRPIIRQYEDENFTKEFYNSSMKDMQIIYDCLAETDLNMGETSQEFREHVKDIVADIMDKSYHGKPGVETTLEMRYNN
jgi:hypothetical protein